MARDDDKDDTTADFERVSGMAKRLKLTGREKDKYIHNHMTGLGYRMVPSYIRPDDDDDDDDGGGGRFRFRSGRGGRSGARDDDDDMF